MDKVIYRDFNHWFSRSHAHGMSSASRDWMEDIWNDIYPTIEASQDDYKRMYIHMMGEAAKRHSEVADAMLKYIKEFRQEDQPSFWRWWSDQELGGR